VGCCCCLHLFRELRYLLQQPCEFSLADHFELLPEPSQTRVRFGKRLRVAAA